MVSQTSKMEKARANREGEKKKESEEKHKKCAICVQRMCLHILPLIAHVDVLNEVLEAFCLLCGFPEGNDVNVYCGRFE